MADILIVDDDIETRQAVRSILKDSPYCDFPIWEADTAEKGLTLIKHKHPTVLLTDLSLPDMDGIEFGKKALKNHPNTHVVVVTHLQMFRTVQDCINAGFSAYLLKPIVKNELLQVFKRLITAQLLRQTPPILEKREGPSEELLEADLGNPIETVIKYIQLKYYEPIKLKKAADFVYLSPSHFSRIFKEETGMNFVEFLTEYRLEKSKHLLKMTSLPIDVIASQTGFSSPAYFSTTFKREEGQTPSEYRNMFSNLTK
ncbi:YesN/AraC family two-component response regulator [Neobacillus niacini]|uniref:DNA-binding response regulator n=1 Tax=Neobacillus niacini TaxID=86668 RepID=UPI002857FA86|nr:DNA-binding response regulator [Neobacillus niacini]MDR7079787.1 YesN/AraC family two-component response regulator [Neobacillus niacini]